MRTHRSSPALTALLLIVGLCQCRTQTVDDDSGRPVEASKHVQAATSATEPSEDTRICAVMCEHSRALACSATAECAGSCAVLLQEQRCRQPLLGALRCMIAEPRSHWSCGEDGLASIESGFCDAEQGAFVSCVEQG